MPDTVISVVNLSKRYLIGHQSAQRESYLALRDVIGREARNFVRKAADLLYGRQIVQGDEVEELWALRDVSFEVKRGEVVGIIGRNGAGKSTLLKILSRITEPTEGRVRLRGRVGSLLEVGTGFHPELTGRENIYLNGAILGMSRAEIRRKFDEIVAFAEVERFLDTPVKRYSSGMYVRLAFAVAAHLEPDILVVDEVLAVGDTAFQKKCLAKMQDVAALERTVLFVSHNISALEAFCPRSLLVEAGRIANDGETHQVVSTYLATHARVGETLKFGRQVGGALKVKEICLLQSLIPVGEMLSGEIRFAAYGDGQIRECAILIQSLRGHRVAVVDLREFGVAPIRLIEGCFTVRFDLSALPLVEGPYSLGLYIVTNDFSGNLDNLAGFDVISSRRQSDFVGYPPEHCGFVHIDAKASLTQLLNGESSSLNYAILPKTITRLLSWPKSPGQIAVISLAPIDIAL